MSSRRLKTAFLTFPRQPRRPWNIPMKMQNEAEKRNEDLADVHSELRGEEITEWYYKPLVIVFAILGFGPLGLLLLWFRPKTKMRVKVLVSIVVIALTVWVMRITFSTYTMILDYYKELGELM